MISFFCFFELGLDEGLVADNHVAVFLVDLDDLELHGLAHEDIVVADGLDVDLAAGQEGLDAEDVYDHATLGAALDVALDDFLVFEGCIDAVPALAGASLLVGENQLTLLVFLILDVHLHHVAHLQVGVVAEFAAGMMPSLL